MKTPTDWEKEFREFFDKTLRPKKPTMVNLERELCVAFISQTIQEAVEVREKELIEKIDGMTFVQPSQAGQFALHTDGYNQALEEVISLIQSK